ncbi:flavodoxin FldB [Biformimicrobium ophioploci]|uniref:Flavodoxin n=1 Tax=Biformimicrobium ophioploci TaxID=3036711 RepID=A0ABQ6LY06_9GAMM|nr:flavodoxin FldB [Microbulbifer sp. NKW57]GMG86994.1 flavodoxin FldB [Microbulbifer sp. NKW57]
MRAPIGLFYGSSTCYTEMAAEKIRQQIGENWIDLHNVAEDPVTEMEAYDFLILGIPTWDYGELQEDWDAVWDQLPELELAGKKVALYGLGDQEGYPEWFQDALGYLHAQVVALGVEPVGYWPREGYRFTGSKALTKDETRFVGLPLDDENEFDLTDERIAAWCDQIMREFGLEQ